MCLHFLVVAKSPPNQRRQPCSEVRGLVVLESCYLRLMYPIFTYGNYSCYTILGCSRGMQVTLVRTFLF